MKQILLAIVLILVPVAAFTSFEVYARTTSTAISGLGDLSSLTDVVADVQALAKKGDLAGAAKRITDYETAWDNAETAMRLLNPTYWGNIDAASDTAIKALRAAKPVPDKVDASLAALMAVLKDPSKAT